MKLPIFLTTLFVFLVLLAQPSLADCVKWTGGSDPGCNSYPGCQDPANQYVTCRIETTGDGQYMATRTNYCTLTNPDCALDRDQWKCTTLAFAQQICPAPPPPPSTNYYRCSGSSCVQDNTNGWTTDPSCGGVCSSPPPPGARYSCNGFGSCVSNPYGGYTDPSCGGTCYVPPPQNRYRCSGFSCIQDPGGWSTDPNCGGACITCDVSSAANPNPVPYQGQVTFSFTSPYGYTNVSLDTGGGTVSCGPTQISGSGPWTWSWTCQSKPANQNMTYTASFNNDQGCAGSVGYTVIGCPPNQPPTAVYPSDGNNVVSINPVFQWGEVWGNKIPFGSSVVLTQVATGYTAQCDQGFGSPPSTVQTPLSCFVWTSGPNQGSPISSLDYKTAYTWQASPRNGCGSVAGPLWHFTTIPQSYFQTFGGNVTAKGQLTNVFLDYSKYVCTKTP